MKIYVLTSDRVNAGGAAINHMSTLVKGFIANGGQSKLVSINYRGRSDEGNKLNVESDNILPKYIFWLGFSRRLFAVHRNKCLRSLLKCIRDEAPRGIVILATDNVSIIEFTSKQCADYGVMFILYRTEAPKGWDLKDAPINLSHYYRFVSRMFVETKELQKIYMQICSTSAVISVVTTAIDCDDIEKKKREKCGRFLAFCGVISNEDKDGLITLIKAFSLLKEYYSELKFYVVGGSNSASYLAELKALVQELNLIDKVIFTGRIDRDKYVWYLKNAEVLLNGKKLWSKNALGISSKVIEYLFSGNAVVMSASDEFVEMLRDGEDVMFVKSDDPNEYCCAVTTLLENDELRRKIGHNGYLKAKDLFDYRKITYRIMQKLI